MNTLINKIYHTVFFVDEKFIFQGALYSSAGVFLVFSILPEEEEEDRLAFQKIFVLNTDT